MADVNEIPQAEDPTGDWKFRDDCPRWATETPNDNTYELIVFDASGGSCQDVYLSRTEFLVLKAHLGAMRGLVVEENMEKRLSDLGSVMNKEQCFLSGDLDQVVHNLRSAREMFRRCADLVMLRSDALDAELEVIYDRASSV